MAQFLGRADSSIWPLTPASGSARTEGGPLGTSGRVPSGGDAQWGCDKTGFEGEVDFNAVSPLLIGLSHPLPGMLGIAFWQGGQSQCGLQPGNSVVSG